MNFGGYELGVRRHAVTIQLDTHRFLNMGEINEDTAPHPTLSPPVRLRAKYENACEVRTDGARGQKPQVNATFLMRLSI